MFDVLRLRPMLTPIPTPLCAWLTLLAQAVPNRSALTFLELLLGAMITDRGFVTEALLVPRSTVDWDTSQADDFRRRGEPWTIKRTRLERARARQSGRKGLAQWCSGVAAGCHASARPRQCCGCCAGKTWRPSRVSWASRQRR